MKQIKVCSVQSYLLNLNLNKKSLVKALLTTAVYIGFTAVSLAQVTAPEIYISAGDSIEELYINDGKVKLGKDASSFSDVQNLGPVSGLKSISLKAVAGKEGGLISMIKTKDGHRIISDELWKVYPSDTGAYPPVDKEGKSWSHPDYDDSQWQFATVDGRFGIPPWNTGKEAEKGFKSLTETMRVYNGEKVMFRFKGSSFNANWIWAGNATYPTKFVYFRRSFSKTKHNTKIPPTRPYGLEILEVTKKKATLSWQPSFSHLGNVKYRIYWNGLYVKTVSECQTELSDFGFSTKPNNYAYVRAEDEAGNLSKPTLFKIIKVKDKIKPKAPSDVKVIKTGANMVELTWKPGSDETQLRLYYVYVGKIAFIAPPGATNFKYSGKMLKPNTKYKVQIVALDLDRNKSKPAETSFKTSKEWIPAKTKINPDSPYKPSVKLTGVTDRTAVLRWNRPSENITNAAIHIYAGDHLENEIKVGNPFSEYQEIKNLKAGKSYTAKIIFVDDQDNKIPSTLVTFKTVKLPEKKALRTLASLTTPDPRHENFKAALTDAKKENCEFMITFGNYGPQDRAQDKHWDNFIKAVDLVKNDMPIFMAPSSHDVQATFLDPINKDLCFSAGKYNRYMHHTGRKLNEVIDLNGVRIIWALSKYYDHTDQELFFQNAILEADSKPEISHVFILCTFQEEIADWERIVANSSKPVIVLDRYTNGNPGYAVTWEPGESFVQASSQRNRAKTADYQKIHIYADKVYFEQRAKDPKSGNYKTTLIHSIDYNRAKQTVKPTMIRNRHTSGMFIGSNQQVNKHPWATNQTLKLVNGKVDFKLNGICPLGKNLKYTIIKQPSSGSLTGNEQNWSYKANSKFTGKDYLLFQVDNGQKSQYGWILFQK